MFAKWIEEDGRFAFGVGGGASIEISDEDHAALMVSQAGGCRIVQGPGGMPLLIQPSPSVDQRISALVARVQAELDGPARALGYDDIKTAITYAEEPSVPRFQLQGIAFRARRSLVWARCYEILAQWKAGQISEPSGDELVAMLEELQQPVVPT